MCCISTVLVAEFQCTSVSCKPCSLNIFLTKKADIEPADLVAVVVIFIIYFIYDHSSFCEGLYWGKLFNLMKEGKY